jgi:hypothetical protein
MSFLQLVYRDPAEFTNLPAELRLQIYRHAFRGATLQVSPVNMQLCARNDILSPFRLIRNGDNNLIRTNRLICRESLPVLNDATTLVVPWPRFGRNDPFGDFPDAFLALIRAIKVDFRSFVHIDRQRLPQLRRVHLTHEVDGAQELPEVIRVLVDPTLGVFTFIQELMDEVPSWQWFMKQFAYLGKEMGFSCSMKAVWRVFAADGVDSGVVRTVFSSYNMTRY